MRAATGFFWGGIVLLAAAHTAHGQEPEDFEELEMESMTPLEAFDKLVELRKRVKRG